MIRETRAVPVETEVRKNVAAGTLNFTGHAAVFNERTWIGPKKWGFWEEVDAGFFDDVLDDRAAFLVNHDPNILLARNGTTMTLTVDERGLVPDAQWDSKDPDAVKWAGRVERGDANEMSFAFTVKEEKWSEDEEGNEIRTLLKAERLYDVSLVTYPAYSGTDGGMRDSAAEVVKRHRGFDPRLEDKPSRTAPQVPAEPLPPAPPVNPIPAPTGPAPVDKPTTPIVEPVSALRHRLLAVRYGLPLTVREIVPVGDVAELGELEDHGDTDDEDVTDDRGFLGEVLEELGEIVGLATEYLSESEPDDRDARVVTAAESVVRTCTDQINTLTGLLASLTSE